MSASRPTNRSKGSTTNKRTGESRDKGPNPKNANQKSSEQSWRLAIRGRLRVNG
jgi:hypothetical protein